MQGTNYDYVLAGGGLQSGLIVLALRAYQPLARVALVEREDRLGGNHTWSVHHHDLTQSQRRWCEPLLLHLWSGYDVAFPRRHRRIDQPYAAVASDHFHEVIVRALGEMPRSSLRLGAEAAEVSTHGVRLRDGTVLSGRRVLDARGQGALGRGSQPPPGTGWQKFLGQEVELETTHDLSHPLLMDATVDQSDGFRFFYLLPFSPTRLLVEDTRFSSTPEVDAPAFREEIEAYVHRRGWRVAKRIREEVGVLPMPWSAPAVDVRSRPLVVGTRGGWYHPGTGYSFPVAARLAETIARWQSNDLEVELERLRRDHERQCRYARFLNRMLFRWYPPASRRWIFERFYGMPESTIARFYALRLSLADRARLLLGKPPQGLSLHHRLGRGSRS